MPERKGAFSLSPFLPRSIFPSAEPKRISAALLPACAERHASPSKRGDGRDEGPFAFRRLAALLMSQ